MSAVRSSLRLHSRYDPAGEASRYLDASLGTRHPSCLLILGGAEDWLSEAARSKFPGSLILSIQYDPYWRGKERPGADFHWYPDDLVGLEAFILHTLTGRIDGGVSVVSWKHSEYAFPEIASQALRTVGDVLSDMAADSGTLRYWAYRWTRNALRNFSEAPEFISAPECAEPIVIAAAGPSLENSLQLLRPYRSGIRLWALSSAFAACVHAGWRPELLITTDAGAWSGAHFYAYRRSFLPGHPLPIAALLSSRIPAEVLHSSPMVLLSQGQPIEADLLAAADLPFIPTLPRGTVAWDAIALALRISTGTILLAGLDMASLDLRSHCRPYAFDSYVSRGESRPRPSLTLVWERETEAFPRRCGPWRRGRSFDLYATGVVDGAASRVYRLLPSPVPVPGAIPVERGGLAALLHGPFPGNPEKRIGARTPELYARRRLAAEVLQSWEAESEEAIRNAHEKGLSRRQRYLLYALGGRGAAGFLAEEARGHIEREYAEGALDAVHTSVGLLREVVS